MLLPDFHLRHEVDQKGQGHYHDECQEALRFFQIQTFGVKPGILQESKPPLHRNVRVLIQDNSCASDNAVSSGLDTLFRSAFSGVV